MQYMDIREWMCYSDVFNMTGIKIPLIWLRNTLISFILGAVTFQIIFINILVVGYHPQLDRDNVLLEAIHPKPIQNDHGHSSLHYHNSKGKNGLHDQDYDMQRNNIPHTFNILQYMKHIFSKNSFDPKQQQTLLSDKADRNLVETDIEKNSKGGIKYDVLNKAMSMTNGMLTNNVVRIPQTDIYVFSAFWDRRTSPPVIFITSMAPRKYLKLHLLCTVGRYVLKAELYEIPGLQKPPFCHYKPVIIECKLPNDKLQNISTVTIM